VYRRPSPLSIFTCLDVTNILVLLTGFFVHVSLCNILLVVNGWMVGHRYNNIKVDLNYMGLSAWTGLVWKRPDG
jgi:hypothetical protein